MRTKNPYIAEFSHAVHEFFFKYKRYSWKRTHRCPRKMLISMVDKGHFYTGGLADRFKGEISSYAWCKQRGYDFRIRYVYPFRLEDYLQPASYDWRLKDGEMSDCFRDIRVVYARGEMGRRMLKLRTRRQIHYWGNMNYLDALNRDKGTDYSWGKLFLELFRPGPELQKAIDSQLAEIGPGYYAAVFRFQNLLGDFHEYRFAELESDDEKRALSDRCLAGLKELVDRFPDRRFLVTSDSAGFLEAASQLDRVHVIPGRLVHCGSSEGEDYDVYMKSFLDFFMISEAEHVYCVGTERMYPSEFPMYAARLHDRPFERVLL